MTEPIRCVRCGAIQAYEGAHYANYAMECRDSLQRLLELARKALEIVATISNHGGPSSCMNIARAALDAMPKKKETEK